MPKQSKTSAKKLAGKSGKKRKISSGSSPLTVIADIPMGKVELSETQAISVALIRNELQQEFVAVRRMYRSKNTDKWKTQDKIWLPFKNMYELCSVLINAYDVGNKLGWGNTYKTEPLIFAFNKNESSTANQRAEPLELKPCLSQIGLFNDS
ncbi:MAG: hypothetical protein IKN16_04815 [Selenomonadaceae bacterium]|nr:hypothetical protein [Selenomonadaceae bacterium]MBR6887746.1 hypothetical protein [Selenomonadaceae bacterium]